MKSLRSVFQQFKQYPSAVIGLVVIALMLLISAYTLITIPYDEAIRLWRGGEAVWYKYPKNAQPEWTNFFRQDPLVKTIFLSTADGSVTKTTEAVTEEMTQITASFPIDYSYEGFPQEIALYFNAQFKEKKPNIALTWLTPDGREIPLTSFSIQTSETYRFSQDKKLPRKFKGLPPEQGLFADPNFDPKVEPAGKEPPTLKGKYELRVVATVFEKDSDVDVEMVFHGKVYGIAGTDHLRRDLTVALLWGLPLALVFGLVAALGTSVLTMIIAAIGVWFGGLVDEIIQRITGVNMVLPFLPILIMIGTFYSRSIWVILGASIALSIFGAGIIGFRSIFLQVKEAPYIDAARAYGAGSWRIVFVYLLPRIIPVLIPGLVSAIPAFVFLEASLAVLGLGDPVLPTWGKIIQDAQANGALYQGHYYWVLEPSVLLMSSGLAFALVGFALDRIFNPRLRGL